MKTPPQKHIQDIWEKRYTQGRALLYCVFIICVIYFLFLILFPIQKLSFDFKNPQASKNTLLDPHSQSPDIVVNKGNIPQESLLITDAPLSTGSYGLLHVQLNTDSKFSASKNNFSWPHGTITLKKSYRAFLLPQGEVINTPHQNQSPIQSGALLSFADGVFLIDGTMVRPIGDASIFEGLGYTWEDVRPVSEEDMGAFTKGKIIELGNIHPNGTVFHDPQTQRYFLIKDGKKHELASYEIAKSYLRDMHPIIISEASTTQEETCTTTLTGWLRTSYECTLPVSRFSSIPGDSYQISARFNDTVALQDMTSEFTHIIDMPTLMTSLSQIKQRIFAHFGAVQ